MRFRSPEESFIAAPQTVVATTTTTMPRRALALCLAPLALLGVVSAFSASTRRTAHAQPLPLAQDAQVSVLNNGPSGQHAQQAARSFLTQVLGKQTTIEHSVLISGSSLRYHSPEHQWSVLCDTNSGNYLMRINSRTHQIYAVNHMENTDFDALARGEGSGDSKANESIEIPRDLSGDTIDHPLSREEAKGQALRYLHLMGLPQQTLVSIAAPWRTRPLSYGKHSFVRTYNFAFADTRYPTEPIIIAVNGADGGLQSLWNPVHPI